MLFICGPHNAGKTTLARALVKLGFVHIETGDIIRALFNKSGTTLSFEEWASGHNNDDPDFFNNEIFSSIRERIGPDGVDKLVITGNRQSNGIDFLVGQINSQDRKKDLVIYLDVPVEELYRRQLERKDRVIPNMNRDKFNSYISFDEQMGLGQIRETASLVVDGSKTLEEIFLEVAGFLREYDYELTRDTQEIVYDRR